VLNNAAAIIAVDIHNRSDIVEERGATWLRGDLIVHEADVIRAQFQARNGGEVHSRNEWGQKGDVLAVAGAGRRVFDDRGRDIFRERSGDITTEELGAERLEEGLERVRIRVTDAGAVVFSVGRACPFVMGRSLAGWDCNRRERQKGSGDSENVLEDHFELS